MSREWKGIKDWGEHLKNCRVKQAVHLPDNLYARMRAHIVRIVRECEGDICWAAEDLGCSEKMVRRYLNFVPFEHLMRNPELADRFDWRSLNERQWRKLLLKHPQFISRAPKKLFRYIRMLDVVIAHPETAPYFDLENLNRYPESFARVLAARPEFAVYCKDFSIFEAHSLKELLRSNPQYFECTRIETLWPYHWDCIIYRHPEILTKMEAKPYTEWPFNFQVCYLRSHPEFETEFTGWDRIEDADRCDLKRDQPQLYARHYEKLTQRR